MLAPLTILLATDVFPPRCGGSGWSTYHLARALRARGHRVVVARPRPGLRLADSPRVAEYDGLPVHELGLRELRVPLARGVSKQERFWPRFAAFLADLARREEVDLLHGQHLLSVPPAVAAGQAAGLPVVATVRDYWPTCPIGTRLPVCPELSRCSVACQVCCLARGSRALRPAVRLALPYVRANLARRQAALRGADRVLAVSNHVAEVLRAGIAGLEPLVLPNFIDLTATGAAAGEEASSTPDAVRATSEVVLYVGKLERHKGADLLPDVLAAAPGAQLLVAGSGPLADDVARRCRERGIVAGFLGERPNEEVLALMRQAAGLLFPARWEEPLSRTLLEAGACGLPVVALNRGGTPDVVVDGETGVLVEHPADLGPALAALLGDPERRIAMGRAARARVASTFAETVVVPRLEALYRELIAERQR